MKFAHVAQQLFNRPLLIAPHKAEMLVAALADRLGVARLITHRDGVRVEMDAAALAEARAEGLAEEPAQCKPYAVEDGVAIIPVEGTLVHKWGLHPFSGMTGYDGIAAKLVMAVDDPEVRAIALEIDSCGGAVSGCQDLADLIYAASRRGGGAKPIWAILSEVAYSAAYWIASACDRIVLPETGGVGSIGVVIMHVDWQDALDEAGIKVNLIHAGAHKVDGNPYARLPEAVRADLQAEVEDIRLMFAEAVARNRGLKVKAVLATEARCYPGGSRSGRETALDLGLADAVQSPGEAWIALQESLAQENKLTQARR